MPSLRLRVTALCAGVCVCATSIPTVTAATLAAPRILSRSDWGADESLRVSAPRTDDTTNTGDNGDTGPTKVSERERECEQMQTDYPQEFKTTDTVTRDENGKQLRWPLRYSPKVKLLVVHHTGIALTGDTRSGAERMRALYSYHTKNRGWGDIGYHFVIDDHGVIYEGRAGGDSVVGGHAYCNNVGTIGIAMMGNFEIEKPTQTQMQSVQWLLRKLADQYGIDPTRTVTYHGKTMSPIIGHEDLLSTDCPGEYLSLTLDQVRTHVASGDTDALIRFPTLARATSSKPTAKPLVQELKALGDTTITGPPGSELAISLLFRAGKTAQREGARIGSVRRSNPRLQLSIEKNGRFAVARRDVSLPSALGAGKSLVIRAKVELPRERGTYTLRIGDVAYTLISEGRSIGRTQQTKQTYQRGSSSSVRTRTSSSARATSSSNTLIRIRLTDPSLTLEAARRLYRGTVESRIVDGKHILINELPLEDYLAGLAEEPDSEPYEKQRAFAIAARTYAAYYADPAHRKFPGKPYDGSDSAAEFQLYGGIAFEKRNPRWVEAVASTRGQVLTYDGQIIRAPYFSASDGRTRSPKEAGWNDFPFAEIFASKPDPWCAGESLRGHGVGMSGCGAEGQAREGKTAEQILRYYYQGTIVKDANGR